MLLIVIGCLLPYLDVNPEYIPYQEECEERNQACDDSCELSRNDRCDDLWSINFSASEDQQTCLKGTDCSDCGCEFEQD